MFIKISIILFCVLSFSSGEEQQFNQPMNFHTRKIRFKWRNYPKSEKIEATTTAATTSEPGTTESQTTDAVTTQPDTTEPVQQTTEAVNDKTNPFRKGFPIMDCLHQKCHDLFMNCFNDDTCKDFMKEWQKKQSLSSQCLPNNKDKNDDNDNNIKHMNIVETTNAPIEETTNVPMEETTNIANEETTNVPNEETTNVPNDESSSSDEKKDVCEYSDIFWKMYQCGVDKYCYNDQRVEIASHNLIISPSYHINSMNNDLNPMTTNSYTKWTLVLVASISAFLVVILYTLIQKLKKDNAINCNGCSRLNISSKLYELYTRSKIYRFTRRKYHRPHHDLKSIEEEDDKAMYGMQTPEKRLQSDKDIALESSDCESQQCGITKVPISSLDQQTEEDDTDDTEINDAKLKDQHQPNNEILHHENKEMDDTS